MFNWLRDTDQAEQYDHWQVRSVTLTVSSSLYPLVFGINWAADEHFVVKVDMIEAGESHKKLGEFEKSQIVITISPKQQLLWGCGSCVLSPPLLSLFLSLHNYPTTL